MPMNTLFGCMGLRKCLATLAVTTHLGLIDDIMLCSGSLATVEQSLTPFDLIVSDVSACPSFVHLRAHFPFM